MRKCYKHPALGARVGRLLSWVVLAALVQGCSVGTLFREELVKERAMVLMSDKTVYAGRTLLPGYRGGRFRFVTDDGRRLRLHSSGVEQLRFSRGEALAGVFVCVPYVDRSGRERKPAWMNCYGQGAHLKLALLGGSWHFDRKGVLEPVSFADGDVYIIGIKEGGKGEYVARMEHSRNTMIRALCKYLADDPDLCERLASKEVDAFDFAEICSRYAPKEKRPEGTYEVRLTDGARHDTDRVKGGAL